MSASSSSSSYRRVAQRDNGNNPTSSASGAPGSSSSSSSFEGTSGSNNSPTRSRGERLEDKCVALGWVIVAVLLARWTDFFSIVWNDDRLNRTLLRVAFGGFTIVVTLFLYLSVYLPRIKGLSDPSVWGVYCPKVVPIMGLTGVLTYLVFIRALWPLWGFLAPIISGTELMGILMASHFIPVFGLC